MQQIHNKRIVAFASEKIFEFVKNDSILSSVGYGNDNGIKSKGETTKVVLGFSVLCVYHIFSPNFLPIYAHLKNGKKCKKCTYNMLPCITIIGVGQQEVCSDVTIFKVASNFSLFLITNLVFKMNEKTQKKKTFKHPLPVSDYFINSHIVWISLWLRIRQEE